jgi:hypothetical protein
MKRLGLISVLALAAMACGGKVNVGDLPDSGGGGGDDGEGGGGGGGSGSGGGLGGQGSTFTAAQVQAALASCSSPHGPAVMPTSTMNQQAAILQGAWVLCPPPSGDQVDTVFSPGMVMSASTGLDSYGSPTGTWTRLTDDGQGGFSPTGGDAGLAETAGIESQGTWSISCDVSPTDPNASCGGITVHISDDSGDSSPLSCFGGTLSFESSPTRMYVVDQQDEWCDVNSGFSADLWLVPL